MNPDRDTSLSESTKYGLIFLRFIATMFVIVPLLFSVGVWSAFQMPAPPGVPVFGILKWLSVVLIPTCVAAGWHFAHLVWLDINSLNGGTHGEHKFVCRPTRGSLIAGVVFSVFYMLIGIGFLVEPGPNSLLIGCFSLVVGSVAAIVMYCGYRWIHGTDRHS